MVMFFALFATTFLSFATFTFPFAATAFEFFNFAFVMNWEKFGVIFVKYFSFWNIGCFCYLDTDVFFAVFWFASRTIIRFAFVTHDIYILILYKKKFFSVKKFKIF